jgi:hypothetical protein
MALEDPTTAAVQQARIACSQRIFRGEVGQDGCFGGALKPVLDDGFAASSKSRAPLSTSW